ncbi:MAG: DUF2127 domain-containing protein [Verrucomicrobiota bacterium]
MTGRKTNPAKEKILHRAFTIGVWVKGVDGILETIGGFLFLLVGRTALSNLVFTLTQHELLEDPDDRLANWLRHASGHLSSDARLFGSSYLLAHGRIKIFLVAGLLRAKLWSYPTAIASLSAFIGYQIYQASLRYSPGLVGLTMFDTIILALTWREYKRAKLVGLTEGQITLAASQQRNKTIGKQKP